MVEQIKCYCGHTTYCDCGPLEEPKQGNKMKRPNQYSKPLESVRTESYHPADHTNNQYANDLNTYIDYLEKQQKRMYSEGELLAFGKFCIGKVADFLDGKGDQTDGQEHSMEELFEQFNKK